MYDPPAQVVHALAAATVAYDPGLQLLQLNEEKDPLGVLYWPTPQPVQALLEDAPLASQYVPAEQAVHPEVPVVTALYAPTVHSWHCWLPVACDHTLYAPAAHAVHARLVVRAKREL